LAITYYKLRTGQLPFPSDLGPIQMMQHHAEGRLSFDAVGEAERAVLAKAAAVEPANRFAHCLEMVAALEQALGISAPGPSTSSGQFSPVVWPAAAGAGAPGPFAKTVWPAAAPTIDAPGAAGALASAAPGLDDAAHTAHVEDLRPLGGSADPSSGEIVLPNAPRPPGPTGAAALEMTVVPEHLLRDTPAEETAVTGWRTQGARTQRAGVPAALIAAAVVLGLGLLGAGGYGVYHVITGGSSGSQNNSQAKAGGPPSPEVKPPTSGSEPNRNETKPKTGDGPDRVAVGEEVKDLVAKRQYAAAAQRVRDAVGEGADEATWAASQHRTIVAAGLAAAADAKKSDDERLAVLEELSRAYSQAHDPDDKVTEVNYRIAEIKADRHFAAAVERLKAGDAAGALDAAQQARVTGLTSALRGRNEARVRLVTEAVEKAKEPSTVAGLKWYIDRLGAPDAEPSDRPALAGLFKRLLARQVERLAPHLPDPTVRDWESLEAACQVAEPTPWVAALRAESVAELLASTVLTPGTAPVKDAERGLAGHKAEGQARAYLDYAKARLAWQVEGNPAAANDMLRAYSVDQEPVPILRPSYRTIAAARVFAEAAQQLRQPNPAQPFKPEDKATAFMWLKAAARLAGAGKADLPAALRLNLALAAWENGDAAVARQYAETFATDDARKDLTPQDAFAVLCVRAAGQDDTTEAGRLARINSYAALARLYRDHPNDLPADLLNRTVVQPVMADLARPPAAASRPDAPRARMLAEVAKAIQRDPRAWSRLGNMGAKVGDLYAAAERLDGRAEYIVQKAFAALQQGAGTGAGASTADLLKEVQRAIDKEPKYPGGHTLRGRLLHMRAVHEPDRGRQLADLRAADQEFRAADRLGGDAAAVDDLRWLYQSWSGACLLLGNFTPDGAEKGRAIRDAFKYAEKLTELDATYFEGWMALGNAAEDVAYYLGDAAYFPQAVRAFDEAKKLSFLPGEARPWLGCGRCQYRRAEKGSRAEAAQWLVKAEADLTAATGKLAQAQPSDPAAVAEASYFLGQCHALRADFAWAGGDAAGGIAQAARADKAYEQGIAAAGRADEAREWGRQIAEARFQLEMNQAQAALATSRPKALGHLKRAREFAGQLRRYSPAAAALKEGKALETEVVLRGSPPELVNELIQVYQAGLEKGSLQDKAAQFEIAKQLATWYGNGQLPGGKDLDASFQYLEKAATFAREAGLAAKVRAETLVEAGDLRRQMSEGAQDQPKKRQYLEEFSDHTRQALALDPDHPFAWYWKVRVAAQLTPRVESVRATEAQGPGRQLAEVRILEESARYYREADDAMPFQQRVQFQWVPGRRAEVEKLAKPALAAAIQAAPADPDVWKWGWTLAEVLANDTAANSLAEARQRVAAAEKAAPKSAPQRDRDRIRQLRKDLDERK
jgi:hypothetical protein